MPSSSRGAVAATVGLPHTQRAAMPTTPRAGRPSCSRRTARSASLTGGNGGVVTGSRVPSAAGTPLDRGPRSDSASRLRGRRRCPPGVWTGSGTPIVGAFTVCDRPASVTERTNCDIQSVLRLLDLVAHRRLLLRRELGRQVVVDEVDDLAGPDVVQPLARLRRDVGGVGPALALRLEVGDLLAADLDGRLERRDLLSLVDVRADRRHQHEGREDDEPQHDHHEAREPDAAEPLPHVDRPPRGPAPRGSAKGEPPSRPRLPLSRRMRQPL